MSQTGHDLPLRRLNPGRAALQACERLGLQTVGDFLALDEARFVGGADCHPRTYAALGRKVTDHLARALQASVELNADQRPVTELCQDPRAERAFLQLGITTVQEFLATPKAELLEVPGFGERTWQKIMDRIQATRPTRAAADSVLLPPSLRDLALCSVALPQPVVHRLQGLGCTTFGEALALPLDAYAPDGQAGTEAAEAIRACLDQLFRVALEQIATLPEAGEVDWPDLRRRLLAVLDGPERDLLRDLLGLDGQPRTLGELALRAGVERAQMAERADHARQRLLGRAASILCRLRYEMGRELRAFEGAVTGEHLAPGSIGHAAAKASGDSWLPLRLAAFCFPGDFHLNGGVLTSLTQEKFEAMRCRLRRLTRPERLPLSLDRLVQRLRPLVDPVPRGVLLHLIAADRRIAVHIDPEQGEMVMRARHSVAVRLRDILEEVQQPLRLQDLVLHYRERHRSASTHRIRRQLRRDPTFVEAGPRVWGLRQWFADELVALTPIADDVAARLPEKKGRQHVPDLLWGRNLDARQQWLLIDCLRLDPRVRCLGRGDVCAAHRGPSAALQDLLAHFRTAMGEIPAERFLENQPEGRKRLLARLLRHNRAFVEPRPGYVDVITNYPLAPDRLGQLHAVVDAALAGRAGYAGIDTVLAAVQGSPLAGDWWNTHLLADLLARQARHDILPGGLVVRRGLQLVPWLHGRVRAALRKARLPLSVPELLVEQPELAEFAGCLEEILPLDPLLQHAGGGRWGLV